jgi:galactose oxidase-like protein
VRRRQARYQVTFRRGRLPGRSSRERSTIRINLHDLPEFCDSFGGHLSTLRSIGSFPVTIQVQDAAGQSAAPQMTTIKILSAGFSPAGSLGVARVWHTATLLGSGKVLVSGGVNTDASITTAELYDPASAKFTQTTGSPTQARFNATATLLLGGKVLLTGGNGVGGPLAAAELYDPATDTFAATTGSMVTARFLHTATLLNDGTVLITGGLDPAGSQSGVSVASAEIYDPVTNSFTLLSNSMSTGRSFHTATLLGTGKVLIAGGSGIASAELYDPAAKTFTPVGNMTMARAGHAATLLKDGKVLLSGGADSFEGTSSSSAEIYDPGSGNFTATNSMTVARSLHSATRLNNGLVLIAGGSGFFYLGGQSDSLSSAELFDPATGNFTATADMTAIRESHTATLLASGQVLIVGGSDGTLGYSPTTTVLATAELY